MDHRPLYTVTQFRTHYGTKKSDITEAPNIKDQYLQYLDALEADDLNVTVEDFGCQREALHELNANLRIDQLNVEDGLRVPRILGLVQGEDGSSYMGLLLSYIDCDGRTLEGAVRADTPKHLRQRWADQVISTLKHLHEAGIVWGDAKAANVLVDRNMDAWIIDFGGGFTEGWVEREKAGTVEGDIQGLGRIVEYISGRTKH
ncbi:hypothetical protein V501_00259 [Pseudogymnoascus sp. VKM F-4519 (FW-2642)]|nr:hypothetical protein V501_00259 [Pseudogymnoascus sp. VKM F-4519 (FW-2642)]